MHCLVAYFRGSAVCLKGKPHKHFRNDLAGEMHDSMASVPWAQDYLMQLMMEKLIKRTYPVAVRNAYWCPRFHQLILVEKIFSTS